MPNEVEILVQPVVSTTISDNKNLIYSLNSLAGQYALTIDLNFDTKKVDKLVSDLQSKINKSSKTIKFGEFDSPNVTLKNISAVTAAKLKQTLEEQKLFATEKLRATVEQNNAQIETANSKMRIQLKSEEIKLARLLADESERAARKEATITNFQNNMGAKADALKLKGLSEQDTKVLDDFKVKISAITKETANASVQMDVLKREFANLSDIINRGSVIDVNLSGRTNISELQNELQKLYDGKVVVKQLNDEVVKGGNIWRTFGAEVKNADGTFTKVKGSINGTTGEVRTLESSLQKTKDTSLNLGVSIKQLVTYFVSFQQIVRVLKDGVKIIQDIDNQMNALRMVTGANDQEAQQMLKTYQQLATSLSSTTLEVAKSANVWVRQGRTMAETNELIKTSQVFAKTAQLEGAEAAKLLTSAINGYQLSVEEAMSVVDKMTAIDMEAATGANDLALALAETANSARIAGVSLDAILAYIGTVQDVTQKGAQTIGHSFSSMFARMQSVKLGSALDEFGEDISKVETVLKQYNIELRDTPTTFRNLEDVIKDVATAWETWTDVQKREVATQISGKQQMENFLVLMENYSKSVDLQTVSLNSAGSALERFNIYQDSSAAKLSELSNQLQIFWSNSLNSDTIKDIVGAGSGLLKFFGDLGNIVSVVTGLFLIFKRESITKTILSIKDSVASLITNLKGFITGQTVANTTLKTGAASATAFGNALNTSLGVIGLFVTALSLIKIGLDNVSRANEEARRKSIEQADSSAAQAKKLSDLYAQYERLAGIANRTNIEEEAFKTLQNQIIPLLGDRKQALKDLTEGTKEYTQAVKDATEAELTKQLNAIRQGRVAAGDELESFASAGIGGVKNKSIEASEVTKTGYKRSQYYWIVEKYLKQYDTQSAGGTDLPFITMPKDSAQTLEFYANLQKAMDGLNYEYQRLYDSGDKAGAEAIAQSQLYKDLSNAMSEMSDPVTKYLDLKVQEAEIQHVLQNGYPKTIAELDNMKESVFDAIGVNEGFRDQIYDMIDNMFPSLSQATVETSGDLGDVGETAKTTAEQIEELAKRTEELTNKIDSAQSAIKTILSAQEEYNKNHEFTADMIQSLLSLEPEYISALIDENGQINLNSEAVANLINDKTAYLKALAAEQVATYAVTSLEKLMAEATEDAGSAAQDAVGGIQSATSEMMNMATKGITAAVAVDKLKSALDRLAGEKGATGIDLEGWKNDVVNYANDLNTIINEAGSGIGGFTGDYSRSGGGGSSKENKEYKADLKETIKLEQQLDDIRSKRSNAQTRLDVTSDLSEQIALREEIIELYKQEQDTLHEINLQRRGSIQTTVDELRSVGFNIKYNAEANELFIENMEHVNEITGKTTDETNELRKTYETMIKSVLENNKDNISNSELWLKLLKEIRGEYNEIFQVQKQARENAIKLLEYQLEDFDDNLDFAGMGKNIEEQTAIYNQIIEEAYKQIDDLQKAGIDSLDPQIIDLRGIIFDAQNNIQDLNKRFFDENIRMYDDYISQHNHMQNWGVDSEIDALRRKQEFIEDQQKKGLLSYKDYVNAMNNVAQQQYTAEINRQKAYIDVILRL